MAARGDDSPPKKIAKISDEHPFYKFRNPVVLNEVKDKKIVFLHGKIGQEQEDAVAILEKKPFDTSQDSLKNLFSVGTELENVIANDIYSSYSAFPRSSYSSFKMTMIYPATEKHIEKYTKQEVIVIEETSEDYQKITLPHLQEENRLSVQWVYNILDKKTESERIVFEDPDPDTGFILLPDMKWDTKDIEALYLIAIVHNRNIKSLRDLTAEHLPLLRHIQEKGQETIEEKYGVKKEKLRVYFHYQPSYYHLHVHFTHISYDAPGTTVTRAHLLSDVIENIELSDNYYQRKSMTFVGRKNDKLTKLLQGSTATR